MPTKVGSSRAVGWIQFRRGQQLGTVPGKAAARSKGGRVTARTVHKAEPLAQELEQEKHTLRRKMTTMESEYETQILQLQSDLGTLK
ncbi:hypothetical protein FJT64_021195 [Amphibalanus amphitrite]|uniref:Uncharacterized protein n=1 Tax=Amphibalanus amphitrite TaxID=1232801 RepID=A0A6A4WJA1_AMPAM|nr:hypothetical protein FJT64_021195 [Amphibalanus amphitrite]